MILGISIYVIIIWIIIGLLAGTAAGRLLHQGKGGFGIVANTLIGLIGALVGGFIFNFIPPTPLAAITINAEELLSAFVGAIILVLIVRMIRR